MQHKYVRFENYGFVLFPMTDSVFHKHAARLFQDGGYKPISAGFVNFMFDGPVCGGRSESLDLNSLPEDTTELKKQLRWQEPAPIEKLADAPVTPAAKWREAGKPDPHEGKYDGERSSLAPGDMTDDELANAIFMHGGRGHP